MAENRQGGVAERWSALARRGRALALDGPLRWPLAPALALCLAAAVAGLLWPVARPPLGSAGAGGGGAPAPPAVGDGAEDLAPFVASRRWGISLADAEAAAAAAEQPSPAPGLNPALAELGFIGVTAQGGRFAALVLADGAVARLSAGDVLADGQTLAAIDVNTATLRAASGEERVLVLFPPVSTP